MDRCRSQEVKEPRGDKGPGTGGGTLVTTPEVMTLLTTTPALLLVRILTVLDFFPKTTGSLFYFNFVDGNPRLRRIPK